jgi:hypothetical protein
MQICSFKEALTIDDAAKQELMGVVLEVMKKLDSVEYHRANLERIVHEQLEARRNVTKPSYDRTTGAEHEFEAFLLQGKATLDVLVKALAPVSNIKLNTYGDDGKRVLKALNNNLPENQAKRADWLIRMVETAVPWIKQWVGPYRDTVAHHKSMESTGFLSIPDETGKLVHHPPMDKKGLALHELANQLFSDLAIFCDDFLAFTYRLVLFEGFEIGYAEETKREKPYDPRYTLMMIDYGKVTQKAT